MSRLHLFEFEDQQWCPKFIRNYLTDYLKHFEKSTGLYKECLPLIEKCLQRSKSREIVDLCSGASGPWTYLAKNLHNVNVTLTDLYPNSTQLESINSLTDLPIRYSERSIDAMDVSNDLPGLRTMFSSFHHFRPEQAKKILSNAIENGQSVTVFEFTERKGFNYVLYPLLSLLGIVITTPMIRPFKLSRIIFTYLVPIVPLVIIWDGYVSNIRTYSIKELCSIVSGLNVDHYECEMGKLKTNVPGINITYLILAPNAEDALIDINRECSNRQEKPQVNEQLAV